MADQQGNPLDQVARLLQTTKEEVLRRFGGAPGATPAPTIADPWATGPSAPGFVQGQQGGRYGGFTPGMSFADMATAVGGGGGVPPVTGVASGGGTGGSGGGGSGGAVPLRGAATGGGGAPPIPPGGGRQIGRAHV